MFNKLALNNIVRSKLNRKTPLERAAIHVGVVQQTETETAHRLHVLPGQLDRVTTGIAGHSTAQDELDIARTAAFVHAPIIHYVLRDCIVHPAGVEYQGGYHAKFPAIRERILSTPTDGIRTATYCMTLVSHRYFGHWLRDACSTALLSDIGQLNILDTRPEWADTGPYMRAFGLRTSFPETFRVEEMHVYSDFSQGSSKRSRYARMKSSLADFVGTERQPGNPVYLRRGATGVARLIEDEDRLCDTLSMQGFEIVDLKHADFHERYRLLANAPAVVTIDGSHINHVHFSMRAGSTLLTLIPADRFTMIHRGVAQAMNIHYGCIVLERGERGYKVDAKEVLQTLDMMP